MKCRCRAPGEAPSALICRIQAVAGPGRTSKRDGTARWKVPSECAPSDAGGTVTPANTYGMGVTWWRKVAAVSMIVPLPGLFHGRSARSPYVAEPAPWPQRRAGRGRPVRLDRKAMLSYPLLVVDPNVPRATSDNRGCWYEIRERGEGEEYWTKFDELTWGRARSGRGGSLWSAKT